MLLSFGSTNPINNDNISITITNNILRTTNLIFLMRKLNVYDIIRIMHINDFKMFKSYS